MNVEGRVAIPISGNAMSRKRIKHTVCIIFAILFIPYIYGHF